MSGDSEIGKIGWVDITAEDAPALRDFYHKVVGWEPDEVDMGGYADFNMTMPGNGEPAAGICHARGGNSGLPTQWLIYIIVADIEQSAALCCENGGSLLVEPKEADGGKICVIKDPAGAVAALYQPG